MVEFIKRKEVYDTMPFSDTIQDENIVSIDVLSLSSYSFTIDSIGRELFQKALERNIQFRIINAHPNDPFSRQQALDYIKGTEALAIGHLTTCYGAFQQLVSDLEKQGKINQLQVRHRKNSIPFSIFRVHYQKENNPKKEFMKVVFYSPDTYGRDRLSFICEEGSDNFNFFAHQFEFMWEESQALEL